MYNAISIRIPRNGRPGYEVCVERDNDGDIIISYNFQGFPNPDPPVIVTLQEATEVAKAITFLVNMDMGISSTVEA